MTKERVCANSPVVSRRTILSAVPAMAVAGAVEAKASSVDPVVTVYRDWITHRTEWTRLSDLPGNENWDTPECVVAFDAEYAAYNKIVDLEPTSLQGIAALAHVLWEHEGPCNRPGTDGYVEQCNQHGNKMLAAIWRYASGKEGLPREF